MKNFTKVTFIATMAALAATPAFAGKADVLAATAQKTAAGWTISATIKHADTGWKHYANRFEVLDMSGKVLGTRVLLHPHVDEQPFTRALRGVNIPVGTTRVRVRAGDIVHGFGGKEVILKLPQ